jgi:phage tail sheath protein FI
VPEYRAPGVYVEEISSGLRTIEGVATSTAGFVGETERGPVQPTLVTSWAEFEQTFGTDSIFLPYAVRGFFRQRRPPPLHRPRLRRRLSSAVGGADGHT